MPLIFRAGWNQVPAHHANADDAAMIQMLTPDENSVYAVINEANNNGQFITPAVQAMFVRALAINGAQVSVRAGAHQVEPEGNGFRLHIGTLYLGVNYHLNIQQSNSGVMYISSISWGAPGTPGYGSENRPGPVPL